MRKFLTLIFIFLYSTVYAQRDLIITQAGTEIRCKILEETSNRFSYAYVNNSGKISKTEIFKTLISTYKFNYFPEDLLPNEKIFRQPSDFQKNNESNTLTKNKTITNNKTTSNDEMLIDSTNIHNKKKTNKKSAEKTTVQINHDPTAETIKKKTKTSYKDSTSQKNITSKNEFSNYMKFRVGFKGGLSNLIDENTDKSAWGLYKEKLRRGINYGADAAIFINDYFGMGVNYLNFHSQNESNNLTFPNLESGTDFKQGSLKSNIKTQFTGVSLLGRVLLDYKTFIVGAITPGVFFHSNSGVENSMKYVFKGICPGVATTLGIDFLLGDNTFGRDIILSFECGYNYGQIKSLNYGGTVGKKNLEKPVNLNRLDFSVGLRFNRFPRYLR